MDPAPLFEALLSHKWLLVSALVIGAIVRFLKSDGPIPFTVPVRVRPWLALGFGLVSGVLNTIATGTPWKQALLEGVGAGLVAIFGHNLVIESLAGGKEIPLPPGPSSTGGSALAFALMVTVMSGCSWWASKGPIVTPDGEKVVLCILAHSSEPIADIEVQCAGAELQLIIDIVGAEKAAEAKAAERRAKAAGSSSAAAPASSGSVRP